MWCVELVLDATRRGAILKFLTIVDGGGSSTGTCATTTEARSSPASSSAEQPTCSGLTPGGPEKCVGSPMARSGDRAPGVRLASENHIPESHRAGAVGLRAAINMGGVDLVAIAIAEATATAGVVAIV